MAQAATAPTRGTKSSAANTSASARRLWEIDAWRGLAIVSMVIYHFAWDLKSFAEVYIDLFSPFWFYFQRSIASSFVLLVGISLSLSPTTGRCKRQMAGRASTGNFFSGGCWSLARGWQWARLCVL